MNSQLCFLCSSGGATELWTPFSSETIHNLEPTVLETRHNDRTLRNQQPHDTSTYLLVNCKLLQSPQRSEGLLTATPSSLCSPHALQVSSETLVRRFWHAQTLCVPTTLNLMRIFSAADTCASGQSLRTKRLYVDQSADNHCRASPWGNQSRVQLSSSLWPKRHFPPKLQRGSVSSKQGHFPTLCQLHQMSLNSFKHSPRGNSGQWPPGRVHLHKESSVCGTDTPFSTR